MPLVSETATIVLRLPGVDERKPLQAGKAHIVAVHEVCRAKRLQVPHGLGRSCSCQVGHGEVVNYGGAGLPALAGSAFTTEPPPRQELSLSHLMQVKKPLQILQAVDRCGRIEHDLGGSHASPGHGAGKVFFCEAPGCISDARASVLSRRGCCAFNGSLQTSSMLLHIYIEMYLFCIVFVGGRRRRKMAPRRYCGRQPTSPQASPSSSVIIICSPRGVRVGA